MERENIITNTYLGRFLYNRRCRLYKKSPAATYFPTLDEQYHRRNESLTSVFGMGTGMTSPLWQPGNKKGNKETKFIK